MNPLHKIRTIRIIQKYNRVISLYNQLCFGIFFFFKLRQTIEIILRVKFKVSGITYPSDPPKAFSNNSDYERARQVGPHVAVAIL